jgi:hypothetical protein
MRIGRRIAASLLVCAGLLLALSASPALAQKRGNAADFNGVWETVIPEVNARYTLTLTVKGKTVTGTFTNDEDGQYNGTLTGSVDPSKDGTVEAGRLEYVYIQPIAGTTGKGYFIVSDQNTIAGFVESEGDSTKYGWEGEKIGTGNQSATRGNADDFTGTWQTAIPKVNARYEMVLKVDGDSVIGWFINLEDRQYNGYITGTVNPGLDGSPEGGRLDYTYRQENGGRGSGYFVVASDGTMAGFTQTLDDSTKYGWEGFRTGRDIPKEIADVPNDEILIGRDDDDDGRTGKRVRITADVTGYDKAGGGPDKCYLADGDTANLLGSDPGDQNWKHLQGQNVCNGDDFWIYDDGKLENL